MEVHVETCLKGRGAGGVSAHSSYLTLQLPSGHPKLTKQYLLLTGIEHPVSLSFLL